MDDNEIQAKRCVNLITHVVMQGISDYEKKVKEFESTTKALKSEPARWILSESTLPFSFLWCCEQLHLAPHRLRSQLGMARIISRAKDRMKTNISTS